MSIEFEVSDVIPAAPEDIFQAWLDSEEHSRFFRNGEQQSLMKPKKIHDWRFFLTRQMEEQG